MQARTLTASQGWRWLAEAYAIFRKAPSRLGMVVMAYWLIVLLMNAIPLLGPILTSLLIPGLSVGVMNACRMTERGQPCEAGTLFSALKTEQKPLLILGGVYLFCSLFALTLSVLIDDGLLLSVMTGQMPLNDEVLANSDFALAALMVLLTMLPVLMSYWYAPLLVSWHKLPIRKALFFSFIACLRNWQAFFAYSLSVFFFGAVLPFVAIGFLSSLMPDASGFLTALLIVPMLMIFGPTVLASFYVSYRDVFSVTDDAAT